MTYETEELREQKRKESIRKYREKNKERLVQYRKEYYERNKERLKELQRQRYLIKTYLTQEEIDTVYKALTEKEETKFVEEDISDEEDSE